MRKKQRHIIFTIIELFLLLLHFSLLKYLLWETYYNYPLTTTALQVVRTSFLSPIPRLSPPPVPTLLHTST